MAQEATLKHQHLSRSKAARKARTRTLIQVGGLLKVAGLLEFFGITEGEDLQLSPEGQNKANALIGCLVEGMEKWLQDPSSEQIQNWQASGKRTLKIYQAKKYHLKEGNN